MDRGYYDDMISIAIKYAGHDLLKGQTAVPQDGEARFSENFEKRMKKFIDDERRKRITSRGVRVASRIAAALLVLVVISTVVVFSSDALRTKVMNMFSNVGGQSADVEFYEVGENDLPAGMIVPGYMPEGYKLAGAEKNGRIFISSYKNSEGDTITISQQSGSSSATVDSDGTAAYETEIKGQKAFISENPEKNFILFSYDSYSFTVSGDIGVSELERIAESIIK